MSKDRIYRRNARMGRFKAKPDEILLLGYLPDFTRRLFSEPIVQQWRRQVWGSKVEKLLLKSGKKPKPWREGGSRSLILRISDNYLTKKSEWRNEVEKFTPPRLIS